MTEFAKLMSLANIYAMPGLQKEILRVVTREKIVNKAGAAAFFQWGEDMWYEDLDEEKGPFVTYFRRYAPGIFQIATEQDVKQMLRSVEVGGTYIKECFIALHKVRFCDTGSGNRIADCYKGSWYRADSRVQAGGCDDGPRLKETTHARSRLLRDGVEAFEDPCARCL